MNNIKIAKENKSKFINLYIRHPSSNGNSYLIAHMYITRGPTNTRIVYHAPNTHRMLSIINRLFYHYIFLQSINTLLIAFTYIKPVYCCQSIGVSQADSRFVGYWKGTTKK